MKALTYTRSGAKSTDTVLPKDIFEAEVNHDLLKQATLRSLSNIRVAGAKTLTRAEVRGGGRKPWRQKGTGRARFGSTRVNIWRHGGVAHGPTGNQNYTKDMPKTMMLASLRSALSAQNSIVKVIESLNVAQPKTKLANNLLVKLQAEGNVLIIAEKFDADFLTATANLPDVVCIKTAQLNANELLRADSIVIEKPALKVLQDWLKVKNAK